MKIFVAIAAMNGRITAHTALSLLAEQAVGASAGIDFHVSVQPGGGLHFARSNLANDFLASDADRLVFVDDDVSWPPGELIKVAMHRVDLCGGCYRFKKDEEDYPVQWLPKPELWADPETGLLEVYSLPTGFLSVSRNVFEKMKEAHPERAFNHQSHKFHGFFCMPYGGGEDVQFCMDWITLGGQVWLDPELSLTHHDGNRTFPGHIGNWLRNRPVPLKEAA